MSRLHEMKISKDKPTVEPGRISLRAGTRTTKTRAKTARAKGENYTPTQSWRDRSQIRSSKMVKSGTVKSIKKQATASTKGDAKQL